jgi:hypothetical protein
LRPSRRLAAAAVAALLAAQLGTGCARRQPPEAELEARVWKRGEPATELASGASVRAGDELYMTLDIASRRALYVYVLSEDANRVRQVLFPCRGWDRSRLLARRVRLPPVLLGRETFWPVGTVTAHERLLVLGSARPVTALEEAVAASGAPLCAAALGDAGARWLDDLRLAGLGSQKGARGLQRGSWRAGDSGQKGWILGFDFRGSESHG